MSPSRAPVLSFAHYFQAPATQATSVSVTTSIISFLSQDPGISSTQARGSYPPYDVGLEMGVFINSSTGETFIGQVIINTN